MQGGANADIPVHGNDGTLGDVFIWGCGEHVNQLILQGKIDHSKVQKNKRTVIYKRRILLEGQ
jgi:hypothetical protein